MRNFYKPLTPISIIIFVSFFLLTLSCSDDPSSPEKEEAIDAVTIGVEGGIIEKDDLSITIPAGSFDGNHDISISDVEDDGAFGENTVSNSYRISGLPDNYAKPLNLKIKYIGDISENYFLALGEESLNRSGTDTSIFYRLYPAQDSSGFIVTELQSSFFSTSPAKNGLSKTKESTFNEIIKFVDQIQTHNTQHFKIYIPLALDSKASELGNTLEEVYKINSGELELHSQDFFGIEVVVSNQEQIADFGLTTLFDNSVKNVFASFSINRSKVNSNNFDEIKKSFGLLFFNMAIWGNYDNFKEKAWSENDYEWLRYAFLTWAEEFYTNDANFKYSPNFINNTMTPFNGLHFGGAVVEEESQDHGYGMASMIKYLADDNELVGKKVFLKTYKNISQNIDPLSSLINNVDDQFVEWLSDYYKKYINGEIYDLPKDHFINNYSSSWDVNDKNDTLKIFNALDEKVDTYLDLSAKIFKINLNQKPDDESYKMKLTMKGPVTEFGLYLHVFGIQNNETVFLGSISGEYYFEIPNLKNSYDKFLVCLVNGQGNPPYINESDIDLKVQIGNNFDGGGGGVREFEYNFCELQLLVNKFYEREDGSTFEQESIQPLFVEGEMIGNRFVAKSEVYVFSDTLEITLSESGDSILLLDWTHWYRTDSPSSIQKTVIEAIGIPIYDSNNGIFKVSGVQTCGNTTHYSYDQNFQGNETTVKSIDCNDNSFLEIKLYKKE